MKAPPFSYVRPSSLAEVFGLIEQHGDDARILAGGQSLMATLNMRLSAPELLIDINRIEDLAGIEMDGGALKIGALARHADVERSDLVAGHAPLITEAMPHIAHPAIRNRGTMGGSLAFADPAAELPACMVALGADFTLASARGERQVAAGEFFHGLYETAIEEGELLTAVRVPAGTANRRSGFAEIVRRHGDFAMAGLAATGEVEGAVLTGLKLVYFAIADRPILATGAGEVAEGADIGGDGLASLIDRVGEALAGDLDPAADLQASAKMKSHLAKVLAGRLLRRLAGQ